MLNTEKINIYADGVQFMLQPVLVLQFNGAHAMEMSLRAASGPKHELQT
jgi:hypothetical protein